jgi:hypothetical protein
MYRLVLPKLFLLSLLLLALTSMKAGPGDGGGGGSVVRCTSENDWAVLDLANATPALAMQNPSAHSRESLSGERITPFRIQETPAFKLARERLSLWAENSPQLVSMVKNAMERVPYFKVQAPLRRLPEYTVSAALRVQCPRAEIKTAILFLLKYGSFVSEPLWSSLSVETQSALLVHEALRQVQITYQYHIENGDLEALVAQIMLGDPKSNTRLQDSDLIKGRLHSYFQAWASYRAASERPCPDKSQTKPSDLMMFALASSFVQDLNDTFDLAQMRRAASKPTGELWKELDAQGFFDQ